MRHWCGVIGAAVGACLWIAGPASAAEPPLAFVKSEPVQATCAQLASAKGLEVAIRNETARQHAAQLSLVEFTRKNGKAIDVDKVCGGLRLNPSKVSLEGAAGTTVTVHGTAQKGGAFSGTLALFTGAGRVAHLGLSITTKPATVQAAPLVESQSVELDHLSPMTQEPVWVPVNAALSKLPPVAPGETAKSLGALAGNNGVVAVTYSGQRKRLTDTTSLIGVDIGDTGAGTYKGKIDLLPDDKEKGAVELNLTMTTWWLFPALLLIAGIVAGVYVQRWIGLEQPVNQLKKRIGELQSRYSGALSKLKKAAKRPSGQRSWGNFEVLDLQRKETELMQRVDSSRKGVVVKLDEAVLTDLKAKIAAVEAQIELLEEIPEHAEALETALNSLEEKAAKRPVDLPRPGNKSKQRLVDSAEETLGGGKVPADKLKSKLEEIDARTAQVGTLQGLEAELERMWSGAKGFEGQADKKEVSDLVKALRALGSQLWTASGSEDLTTAAEEVQKARQRVAVIWAGIADRESLPLELQSVATQVVAAGNETSAAKILEEAAPQVIESAIAVPAAPQVEVAAAAAAAPADAAPTPPTTLPPAEEPQLDQGQVERKKSRAATYQWIVIIVVGAAVFSAGMQALYVGKAWGSSFWDWLAILVWGVGVQATVSGLATSLDGLGFLRRS